MLKDNGYRTALIGKWHLGYDHKFNPTHFGFDTYRGFIGGAIDYHSHICRHGKRELDWWKDKKIENEEGYATDLLTNYAIDFIKQNKATPFFLYLTHATPHTPYQGRDRNSTKSISDIYHEMIQTLDESTGRIMDTLKQLNLDTNTLVVFMSDNGGADETRDNKPFKGKKGQLHEGGIRVPMIARWPDKIPPNTTNTQLAMSMDWMTTISHLTQSPLPRNHKLDGINLSPILFGSSQKTSRTLHWKQREDWAIRQGNWKLIGHTDSPKGLYNLDQDKTESNNLIESKKAITQHLLKEHQAWQSTLPTLP